MVDLQALFDAYAKAQARADEESNLYTRATGKGYRAAATKAFRRLSAAIKAEYPGLSHVQEASLIQRLNADYLNRQEAENAKR